MASEWRSVRLGELGEVNRGRSRHRPRNAPHLYGGPYPFIQTGDIKAANGLIASHSQTYSEAGLAQSRLWPAGTMVITIAANIAETAILSYPACFPDSVVGFIADQNKADVRFIEFLFRFLRRQIQHENVGTGSVQDNINLQTLDRLELKLPELKGQRAIAHILGTLDDKIELNRRMNETLESMARALFKAWFVDFEPVRAKLEGRWRRGQSLPGLPAHLYDLFPDRLVDSKLGEIPEGWKIGLLGNVSEHPRRSKQPAQITPETPYIALEHMPKRSIALSQWSVANKLESNKYEFKYGEILFGKLRPYFHKVGIAPVDGVCSTDIVVLTPKSPAWYGFVLAHVASDAFVEYANAGSTGTKMPRTNWSEMSRYIVALPTEKVAAAFNRYIQPASEEIVVKIHESRTLTNFRDALLPKLISGEFRITEVDKYLKGRF